MKSQLKTIELKVGEFMAANHIDEAGKLIVALSGGADSVALLLILRALGYDCMAAHCNFHLRGDESDRDERFVRELCDRLGISLQVIHFDVDARRRQSGESIEMACRSLRYEWFDSLLSETGATDIAVAHHRDDNVETFFLNALRGSGVAGLKAMQPRNGHIIRPLLCLSRSEIISYLAESEQDYITDSTNADTQFLRNRLRNELIPEMNRLFAGASDRISETIACVRDNYAMLEDYISQLRSRYVDNSGVINVAAITADIPHPDSVIFQLTRDGDIDRRMAQEIARRPMAAGLTFGSYTLDRGKLRPRSAERFSAMAVTPGTAPLEMTRGSVAEFHPSRDPMRAWFDRKVLDGNPVFEVRPWRIGDRFRPFGMHGSKKLSDLFAGFKLDENAKSAVKVLTRNDEIIWVIGLRASALFTVNDKTEEFVEFHWIEK